MKQLKSKINQSNSIVWFSRIAVAMAFVLTTLNVNSACYVDGYGTLDSK